MGSRRVQGFTLIELMVVATIIGISVLAFTPSFIFAMADRRASSAAAEVVRVGRRARAEAIGTQRAHLVWLRPGLGNTGVVQLLRGLSSQCDVQRWLGLSAACPANGSDGGTTCLENINLSDTHWYHNPFQIRLRTVRAGQESGPNLVATLGGPETSTIALCYEANGATGWSTAALADRMPFSQRNELAAAGGAFVFTIGLFDESLNSVVGTPRVLAYPLGTTPRKQR